MGQLLLVLVVAVTVAAVVFGVTVLVSGRDPGLVPAEPDGRAVPLPGTRPLRETDVTAVRFDTAPRGYRMSQVDEAMRRAAYDIGYKVELIGVLEAEIDALRDGRTADAETLRRAREEAAGPAAATPAVAGGPDAPETVDGPGGPETVDGDPTRPAAPVVVAPLSADAPAVDAGTPRDTGVTPPPVGAESLRPAVDPVAGSAADPAAADGASTDPRPAPTDAEAHETADDRATRDRAVGDRAADDRAADDRAPGRPGAAVRSEPV